MAKSFICNVFNRISVYFSKSISSTPSELDQQLLKDKKHFLHFTHENLVMGVLGSGKSTFLQQLKRIYLDGGKIDEKVRKSRRDDIRKYIINLIMGLLSEVPLTSLTSLKHLALVKWLEHNLTKTGYKCFQEYTDYVSLPRHFFNLSHFVNMLLQNASVRKAFQRYCRLQSNDNLEYFLQRVDVIFNDDYLPSDEDVLRCPKFSNTVKQLSMHLAYDGFTNTYSFLETNYMLYRKLLKVLSPPSGIYDVKYIIIFMVDFSSPDQLYDSLITLERLVVSAYHFCYKIYVILNKVDVFKERILAGESLESFFSSFPEFPGFLDTFDQQFLAKNAWEMREDRRVLIGIKFIIQKIEEDHNNYSDRYFLLNHVLCGSFFSGVLDEDYVRRVMYDCYLFNRHTIIDGRIF